VVSSWAFGRQALAARVGGALLLEQKRCGYVAREVAIMRRLRKPPPSPAARQRPFSSVLV